MYLLDMTHLVENLIICPAQKISISMSKLRGLPLSSVLRRQYLHQRGLCSSKNMTEEEKEREIERIRKNASLEEPPTGCCQSGCANCVFIVWAEALTAKMEHAGPEVRQKILNLVDDPSMKAYLEMELRLRGLNKN